MKLPQSLDLDQRLNYLNDRANIYGNQILSNASINSRIKIITDEPLPPLQGNFVNNSKLSLDEEGPRSSKYLSINNKLYSPETSARFH